MKTLLLITMTVLLASCGGGGGGGGTSPHTGQPAQPQFCETGWIWSVSAEACEVDLITPLPDRVNSLFTSLISEYVSRATITELPSIMKYVRLTEEFNGTSILGGCFKFESGNREIRINQTEWNKKTTGEKKFIMFHELGHCVEDLNHTFDAANLDCIPQLEDDTVKLMDACQEASETLHIVNQPEDWKIQDSDHALGPYYYSYQLPNGVIAWQYEPIFGNDGYYILLNEYALSDVFTVYFNSL